MIHRRSASAALGGGLLVAGGLLSGGAAQASSGAHVEVFSDSGAVAFAGAGGTDFGSKGVGGSGPETLADAIDYLDTEDGGTITFASSLSGHTIELNASLPRLYGNTTIIGPGAGKLAVDGRGVYSTFAGHASSDLTVSGLTIEGGGAYVYSGSLTVTNSVIEDSQGDAISTGFFHPAKATIRLTDDTIRDNKSEAVDTLTGDAVTIVHSLIEHNSGGLDVYGGPVTISGSSIVDNGVLGGEGYGGIYERRLYGHGPVRIVNSTISANVFDGDGHNPNEFTGGIGLGSEINLTLIGDTVSGNEVDDLDSEVGAGAEGGGISMGITYFPSTPSLSKLTIEDSVVASNKVVAAAGPAYAKYPDIAIAAGVKSLIKDSLIGVGAKAADTLTALTFGSGSQKGTTAHPLNPKLGKLEAEGSKKATPTGALLVQEPEKGSPLIGKGAAKPFSSALDPFTTDELGTKRPLKGVTIGAFQVPPKKRPKPRK